METKTQSRAREEANVRDYYQNLLRDFQRDIRRTMGPIRETGQGNEFMKKLEDFAKELDKEVDSFADRPAGSKDKEVDAMTKDILSATPAGRVDIERNADAVAAKSTSEDDRPDEAQAAPKPAKPTGGGTQ